MKTTEKRREITRKINEGTIKEVGSVSSKSKVIRNLNSDQCDKILGAGIITYALYNDIIAKEKVEIFSQPTGSGGGNPSGSEPKPSDEKDENGDELESSGQIDTPLPSTEIPEDAMQKLASELWTGDGKSDDDINYMTNKGLVDINAVKKDMQIPDIKNVVSGQAKVMDGIVSSQVNTNKAILLVKAHVDKIAKDTEGMGSGSLEVKVSTVKKGKKIEGVHYHPKFKDIVEKLQLNADKCVYLSGGAGAGKTTLANQVAEVMELPFGFLSCTEGMSEAHLLGRMLFDGQYVESQFVKLYEAGGVFLLDEMDAMDSNVAVVINSALANGHVSVPNRRDNPVAKRHENFYVIGAGNTWGTGQGSNVYSGRNKLDGATLDRFWMVEFDYDKKLEKMLAQTTKMYDAVLQLRKRVAEYGLNRIVGTRRFKDAGICHANGKDVKYVVDHITTGWTKEEIDKVGVRDIIANVEGK